MPILRTVLTGHFPITIKKLIVWVTYQSWPRLTASLRYRLILLFICLYKTLLLWHGLLLEIDLSLLKGRKDCSLRSVACIVKSNERPSCSKVYRYGVYKPFELSLAYFDSIVRFASWLDQKWFGVVHEYLSCISHWTEKQRLYVSESLSTFLP